MPRLTPLAKPLPSICHNHALNTCQIFNNLRSGNELILLSQCLDGMSLSHADLERHEPTILQQLRPLAPKAALEIQPVGPARKRRMRLAPARLGPQSRHIPIGNIRRIRENRCELLLFEWLQ